MRFRCFDISSFRCFDVSSFRYFDVSIFRILGVSSFPDNGLITLQSYIKKFQNNNGQVFFICLGLYRICCNYSLTSIKVRASPPVGQREGLHIS